MAGASAAATVAGLGGGDVAMLENVRFELGETSKDDAEREVLAGRLAELADAYVGDGFGAMHRKHASVYDLPRLLPHAAGQLVLAELSVLRQLTTDPPRPYVVVLGGAKASDKLAVIGSLTRIARPAAHRRRHGLHVPGGPGPPGGGLAAGGRSDPAGVGRAGRGGQRRGGGGAAGGPRGGRSRLGADASAEVVAGPDIPAGRIALDIGPATRELFARKLADAKTVFWNGPPGVFEFPAFADGTRAVAEAISAVTGLTVVGGGDSAAAVRRLGFPDDAFTHISTGGGASLEYLEGAALPGLTALEAP